MPSQPESMHGTSVAPNPAEFASLRDAPCLPVHKVATTGFEGSRPKIEPSHESASTRPQALSCFDRLVFGGRPPQCVSRYGTPCSALRACARAWAPKCGAQPPLRIHEFRRAACAPHGGPRSQFQPICEKSDTVSKIGHSVRRVPTTPHAVFVTSAKARARHTDTDGPVHGRRSWLGACPNAVAWGHSPKTRSPQVTPTMRRVVERAICFLFEKRRQVAMQSWQGASYGNSCGKSKTRRARGETLVALARCPRYWTRIRVGA